MRTFDFVLGILVLPMAWAIGDLMWPLVMGEPSVILTHLGWSLRIGCA